MEGFYRARFLYQLTAEGEAAESALNLFLELIQRPGELQATALRDLIDSLERIRELSKPAALDVGKLHAEFRGLFDRFEELTSRAQAFMRNLQGTIDLQGMTAAQFLDYKEMLIEYLERFLSELVLATSEIAERLTQIGDVEAVLSEVAERALADVLDSTESLKAEERGRWIGRWIGFRRWFLGGAGGVSQAEILRRKSREAIPALLYTLSAIHERRVSRSDRVTDWKTLARWFAEAPDDPSAHRLWRGAFALAPARHLQINDETLSQRDQSKETPRTSWLEAEPVWVSPKFRRTGRAVRGGPAPVIDLKKEKEWLARMASDEAGQLGEARRLLANGRCLRLSDLATMNAASLELFLDLLGEALSSRTADSEAAEATSTDGSLTIRLEPISGGGLATIRSSEGTLTGPDAWVTIREAYQPAQPEAIA